MTAQTQDRTDLDHPGLAPRLEDTKAHLGTIAPAELLSVLGEEQARLVRQESTEPALGRISVGHRLPTVVLPDHTGREVTVGVDNPAVVVFYRGAWCPYCNVALSAYQHEVLPVARELGVAFVAISPQGPTGSEEIARGNELTFPVLTDEGGRYADLLGLRFDLTDDVAEVHRALGNDFDSINAGSEWSLPRPTVIVTDADGVVTYVDVQADYTRRTEPADVVAAVRAVAGR